jgi:predicted nucleotidyltransferase
MNRAQILVRIGPLRSRLNEEFGVAELSLFGSVARGDEQAGSDVDLLVEFNRPTGMFGLIRLQQFLERVLGCRVDLGTRGSLRPQDRDPILREAIRVA